MQPSDLLEDYLTREELARELGIAVRTLARYDALGKGPPRLRLGGHVLYHREQARAWLRARLSEHG